MAIALGMEAIRAGFLAYYLSAAQLVEDLKKAAPQDRLDAKLRSLGRYPLLILDEIGYLPMDRVGAHLFFRLVRHRYEKGSTIFISNRHVTGPTVSSNSPYILPPLLEPDWGGFGAGSSSSTVRYFP